MADDDDVDADDLEDDSHRATEPRFVIGELILSIKACSWRTYPSTDVAAKMRPAAAAASAAAAPAYTVLRVRSPAANLLPNAANRSRGDERAMVRIMVARQGWFTSEVWNMEVQQVWQSGGGWRAIVQLIGPLGGQA